MSAEKELATRPPLNLRGQKGDPLGESGRSKLVSQRASACDQASSGAALPVAPKKKASQFAETRIINFLLQLIWDWQCASAGWLVQLTAIVCTLAASFR